MEPVNTRVLIVDDDDFALDVLENTLSRLGFSVVIAHDGLEAMKILRQGEIHLMVTDWDMPNLNGVELCRAMRREELSGYVYIIMLTGREGSKQRMEGLCAGADDFINKPVDPEELFVCLKTAERILSLETRDLALFAMAKLAESRDTETGAHIERVQAYSRLIAQNLLSDVKSYYGVDEEYIRLLHQTSPLHDLGKVAIPDAVLLKPGKLTRDEFEIMKTHTIVGARTLDAALQRFPNARFLHFAREIAASHHEKYDGTGYPHGLIGKQIPLCGRIVAVADVYDALTSRRVYKEPISHEKSKAIILRDRGTHFDPDVVDAFLLAETHILAVRAKLGDEFKPSDEPVAIPAPPLPSQREVSPLKILLVEDDPLLLEKLTTLLTATGAIVLPTTNGEEAIAAAAKHHPRIVVSDWMMPKMDGVELCRHMRQSDPTNSVYFIMLTANSDTNRLLDAYEAGINDFVSKPFNPEELLARVRAGLRAAKLNDELIRKATGSQAMNAQLTILNSRLERLSITDELTGLFNRRHAMSRLEEHWAIGDRHARPLTIAMIDLDHFKQINDVYGHDAGDTVLRHLAGILRDQTRGTDVVSRIGGEEFLIIFPSQSGHEAIICAERFRAAVASKPCDYRGVPIKATVSGGLASRTPTMSQSADLLRAADQALYAAKHGGRNKIHAGEDTLTQQLRIGAVPSDSARIPIDFDAVLQRCGGDASFAASMTEKFRGSAVKEIEKIAVALSHADADALRRAAHTSKSMAAYMSADVAAKLANEIEELGRANRLEEVSPLLEKLRAEVNDAIAWIDRSGVAIGGKVEAEV